jgi:WD40 repeat protein
MKDALATIESIAKSLSLIAIPIVVAVGGWFIQRSLSDQSIKKDYVNIAVSILQKTEKETGPELREWAADLLNDNSPTKFSPQTLAQLKSGEIKLGALTAILQSQGGSLVISPDARSFSIGGTDGSIRVFDFATGRLMSSLNGHSDAVSSLAYSPDGRHLVSGSFDKTAIIWDWLLAKAERRLMGHTAPIIGVGVAPDGRILLTRSLDKTVKYWNFADGSELRTVALE